jgi:hypothetical protein
MTRRLIKDIPYTAFTEFLEYLEAGGYIIGVSTRMRELAAQFRPKGRVPNLTAEQERERSRLVARHRLLGGLAESEVKFALSLALNHKRIRVYKSGGEICLSREAMYTPGTREVFIIHGHK